MDSFDYIQAARGSALMDRSTEDRTELIRTAISRAYSLKGLPIPQAVDYENIVRETEAKISSSYKFMTGQELSIIVELGVAGELTKETRPTASAIFGWMSAYINGEARRAALREYHNRNRGDQERLLTPAETAELNRQAEVRGINALWNEYKQHGRILENEHLRGYVAMVCDGLVARHVFDIRPEHWELARKKADENRHRLMRSTIFDRALGYNAEMLAKWCMLEMCFGALVKSGRELEISA